MFESFNIIASELGVSLWLLLAITIWSGVWKLAALWKSARRGSLIWFVILAIVNTVGILEILYIFVFSKMNILKPEKPEKTEKVSKKDSKSAKSNKSKKKSE